ncbi:amidase domain-containing protein [Actinophytocola sp. NPDC049390]|uniref:amidase domain-containing protein n=1 Tax=Actinophytocola sp. NPDC049390 TaxID=3363894 RepID=UPI003799E239
MVSFQQLKDADPDGFATAADDWMKIAKEADTAAEDIYDRGGKALRENWADGVADLVEGHVRKLGQDYQAAGMTIRGVVTTLDGFADSLRLAKRNLEDAVHFATSRGLAVDANGKVTVPQGATDPRTADDAKRAGWLIWDAVNDATKIDEQAAASLRKLIQPAHITRNLSQQELADQTTNGAVKAAGHTSLNMLKQTMPFNADKQTQTAWWNSLTPAQRDEYMRAAPLELYDMPGIPEQTKKELAGDGPLNRMEMLRWAQENGSSTNTDVKGMNNCTNFVSHAMHDGGGLDETGSWNEKRTGWDPTGKVDAHLGSREWQLAKAHHQYVLDNGGQSVPTAQARPGDIVYLKDQTGDIHHTALVTAVTPGGDVMVTQHNPNHTDVNVVDRVEAGRIYSGNDDQILVVRPGFR